ncbi:MAG: type II secretion system minor pseudopilin GspI [Gammaproteobacteria bacterium]|nr:type II secretion system minor pseudopilin GspI [Gammaproteobacteria bacterium]
MKVPHSQKGFTLIELMVAIAILAIVGTAIFYSNSQVIQQQIYLEEKTVAQWILQNQLALIRVEKRVNRENPRPISRMRREVRYGNRIYEVTVQQSDASVLVGSAQAIRIEVRRKIDGDLMQPLLTLDTFVALE